jgi:alpha-amylase/alpha-mannosidase (GH57 family)
MNDRPLNVIFLWHMHQPDYRDPESGVSLLPWVRLHGTKDYLDMVTILDEFPGIRQNFNLVPSLLDQLQGYVDGTLRDRVLELTLIEAEKLTPSERAEILQSFFHAHWDNMVKPYPRYWELLQLRGFHPAPEALPEIQRFFTARDLLDLQIWYNLTWIDPVFRREYPELERLFARQRNFAEADKLTLLEIQKKIIGRIIPAYREREEQDRIELSTTPYYHPILPLLYDTGLAAVSQPHDPLPELRFSHPEDARTQIERAVARHQFYFGRKPRGMWPSEGSVCQELIPLFAAAGLRWIATDEGILARSQAAAGDDPTVKEARYRAWQAEEGRAKVEIIFRDHHLSDLIGFVYSHWNEQQAADDFIAKLVKIGSELGSRAGESAVAIILDGENAWEHYPEDGRPFLKELYGRLQDHPGLNSITVSDYLEKRQEPAPKISRLYPGSWINANFRIWIGHQEDNLAWVYLGRARRALQLFEQSARKRIESDKELKLNINNAWEHIYIAEGSDWNWWYGDDHSSENDADFDELFRRHLAAVYRAIGEEIPDYLYRPIIQADKILHPVNEISSFINPRINGENVNYFEWQGAAFCDVASLGGAMHRTEYLVNEIYYGFNLENFFLRIDIDRETVIGEDSFPVIQLTNSRRERFQCRIKPDTNSSDNPKKTDNTDSCKSLSVSFRSLDKDQPEQVFKEFADNRNSQALATGADSSPDADSENTIEFALKEIFEIRIPFALLNLETGDDLNFAVVIEQQGYEVQRIPAGGYLHLTVPAPDFEDRMWYV